MNNKQKFKQTVLKVQEIRKKYGEPLEEQIPEENNLEKKIKLLEARNAILELDFLEEKPFYAFCGPSYGSYRPFKCNKRGRILAVPMCYCVTLYQHDLESTFPKEDIQIPYDLRGFWKMQQAVQLMEDFVKFQNKSQYVLLWEHRRLKNQEKAKVAEYFKILEEFLAMGTSSCNFKKEITYHDLHFIINTKNVKLDVVPLCKILTKYYANVVTRINHYLETYSSKADEQKLEDIKADFTELMEKHFVNIP